MPRPRQPRRTATLASLAAQLKVSRTTVSNAYNRPDQLSPELRERILATAKQLGYPGPDPVARSLRTRKAGAVGLLLTEALSYSFSDPAAVDFLAGLAEACDAAGQGLLLVPAGPRRDDVAAAGVVQQAGVDGFVVYSVAASDPYFAAVLERNQPVVICDQPRDVPGTSSVAIDDRGAMRAVAEHVLRLGHTEIGILCMRLGRDRNDGVVDAPRLRAPEFHVQRERIGGVLDAVGSQGRDRESVLIVERYDHDIDAGTSGAAEIFERNPRITALLCTSDVLALGALIFARASGRTVPRDLSVTGFDGVDQARRAGLTTVRQPARVKGRRAGELLLTPPQGGTVSELLDTEFVVGWTTGPAPAA